MNLFLFFTYGVGPSLWRSSGIYEREVLLYKTLEQSSVATTFVIYENMSSLPFSSHFKQINLWPERPYTDLPLVRHIFNLLHSFYSLPSLISSARTADLLKTNQIPGSLIPVLVSLLTGVPLYVRAGYESYLFSKLTRRGPLVRLFSYLQSFLAYHCATSISITSESSADFIVSTFKVRRSKITVHPNYVDQSLFCPPDHEAPPSILSVGRDTLQKRHSILISATYDLPLPVTIIGKDITKRHHESSHPSNLQLLEPLSSRTLAAHYSSNRYFVICSSFEGHPKVLIEAMSSGAIILASPATGVTDNLHHLSNAYIIDPTPEAIIKAITLLESNPLLRKTIRTNSTLLAKSLFSFDSYLAREHDILHNAISRTRQVSVPSI